VDSDPTGPPVAWVDVSEALREDPRCAFMVSKASRHISQIAGHGRVFRITFGTGPHDGHSVILKLASRWESKVLQRTAAELPRTVPALYGSPIELGDSPEGPVGLLMEDLAPGGEELRAPDPATQTAAYSGAIFPLAVVHDHFADDVARLAPRQAVNGLLSAAVLALPDLLRLLGAVGLPLDPASIDELADIGRHVEEHIDRCLSPHAQTLVHGDFHPANIIMSESREDVRIIDWGRSGAGPPEWDLVLCGESEIRLYLATRRAVADREMELEPFCARLRAAVIVRMYEFICTTVNLVFGHRPKSSDAVPVGPLLTMIPMYLDRLVLAATSEPFLGGSPIWPRRYAGGVG
jgi:hypothetical protein